MKMILRVLLASCVCCHCSASCIGQDTAPGVAQAVRSLDDIRAEVRKKPSNTEGSSFGSMGAGSAGGLSGESAGYPDMSSGMSSVGGMGMMPTPSEKQLLAQIVHQLRARLDSKKFKREDVEKQLRAALQQYFSADMEERVSEFDKVKARVVEMETKLQRRLQRENEIIDLQLKQMLYQADGLDFSVPGGVENGAANSYGAGMGAGGYGEAGRLFGSIGDVDAKLPQGGLEADLGGATVGVEAGSIGYDVSFKLTRVHRLDPDALWEYDPLGTYRSLPVSSDKSETPESNVEKMKMIIVALSQFHDRFNHFPGSSNRQFRNQPPHSWRVAILPLLNHADLFNAYHFDQPWDSEQNLEVAQKMPDMFRTSADTKNMTSFLMLTGEGAFSSEGSPTGFRDITDGTSNTIALIESDHDVPWTKPEDFSYSAAGPLPKLSPARLVAMADSTVRRLPEMTDEDFRTFITRSDGVPTSIKLGEPR